MQDRHHVSELGLCDESLAFLVYIIRIMDEIDTSNDDLTFVCCDEKFGQARASWVAKFVTEDEVIEYWLIKKDERYTALVTRYIDPDGSMCCVFTHFVLLPINYEGVTILMQELPAADKYFEEMLLH